MNTSPVQRLMNRRTCTLLPTTKALLQLETPHPDREFKGLTKEQQRQTEYYNRNARDLPPLSEGDVVRIKPFQVGDKVWKKGTVTSRLDERSDMLESPDEATYRRNRLHLKKTKETPDPPTTADIPFTESSEDKLIHKQVPPVPLRQPHPSPQQDHSASDDLQHT